MDSLLIMGGKYLSTLLKRLNLGNGSTWPGHIALKLNRNFIRSILSRSNTKIIVIAGTNGKTTTSSLIKSTLIKNGQTVLHNESGANLLNGIASTILLKATNNAKLKESYAIFEIDENILPLLLEQLQPDYLVLLNLFRDQLDRYGEIHTIAKKWQEKINNLTDKTTLILNADDPQIAQLGSKRKHNVFYFSVKTLKNSKNIKQVAADSIFCPNCQYNLSYSNKTFSHLGEWRCTHCGLKKPNPTVEHFSFYPLVGKYNEYNTHAAVLALQRIGLSNAEISTGFKEFKPAFGRQEILEYKGKKVQIFLSKNPTSFNQSFATIKDLQAKNLLLILNDRVPDGHDISWIWDIDLTGIHNIKKILLSGDRVYDMALRVKYEEYKNTQTFRNLELAVQTGIEMTKENEVLYILPNYSAMLEVRKILTGKKIL